MTRKTEMTSEEKLKMVNYYLCKLMHIANSAMIKEKYELALSALSAYCNIQYKVNQVYKDKEAEDLVMEISKKIMEMPIDYEAQKKTVMFYDGFGLDRRGISIVMNKAICMNGYRLVYISPLQKKGMQPTLEKVLNSFQVDWRFVDTKISYTKMCQQLKYIVENTKPEVAFFYTLPNDVAGAAVFNELKGKCFRIQIDLTDHAFWIGLNTFDICNGGRQFSANIQHLYRGIPLDKMTQLDANLFVDDCPFQGLPFGNNSRYIFSGGALYKTLGDEKNTYYKIVDHILKNHSDILFLYAGSGDTSQMDKLSQENPGRVFLIKERPDFFQIIQHCTLYLNTYPMFGGLMMRYAALAGKIPITLKHNNDSDGILIDQEKRGIEYETYDQLINDVDRLLNDREYLKEREKKLIGAVITEECFERNIKLLIDEHKTEFPYSDIQPVDVKQFQREYLERFSYYDIVESIVNKRDWKLMMYFPKEIPYRIYGKVNRRR